MATLATKPLLIIDGSQGEGGGQILRTAMTLAAITGTGIHITGIRAKRPKPGLQRQHLTAVQAASTVCSGALTGDELGSSELRFTPGTIRGGTYTFATGTAGSVTLILQTLLPILLQASAESHLTLVGGTHNTFAPPADYLLDVFLPQLRNMGANVIATLERHGFYPAGGGRLTATIHPLAQGAKLQPLHLHDRGQPLTKSAVALIADLPGEIAVRELALVQKRLTMSDAEARPHQLPEGQGPGNVLLLKYAYEHVTEIFTGFGKKGVTAEAVAEGTVAEARAYFRSDAPVGPHLADQLLLPLALAGAGSFVTATPTLHTTTNIAIIEQFLPVTFTIREIGSRAKDPTFEISVAPR